MGIADDTAWEKDLATPCPSRPARTGDPAEAEGEGERPGVRLSSPSPSPSSSSPSSLSEDESHASSHSASLRRRDDTDSPRRKDFDRSDEDREPEGVLGRGKSEGLSESETCGLVECGRAGGAEGMEGG